ncbi:hypothetical protein Cni_G07925 [Canna indica]|uniref:Uncharacterized protein n=1 Tax=Canna indica TaxID=4628 RepID=A0AAQ3JZN6_9LILI|nr:hypothetical protein Cni_G07925 [Canna indica]
MLRQVATRNQRSKGFTLKNALQLCLLVIVCSWIIYQIKHSYDHQRKAYEDSNYKKPSQSSAKFHSKDLPHTRTKDAAEDTAQDLKHKKVRAKETKVVDNQRYQDVSREARENSFNGDDASSEVVQGAPVVEHDVLPQEAPQGDLKHDDHLVISEDSGIRNFDEKQMDNVERKRRDFEGYNSSAPKLLDVSEADMKYQANLTRNESESDMKLSSEKLIFDLTAKNFTSVADNKDTQINLTEVKKEINLTPLQSGKTVLHSAQDQNATMEIRNAWEISTVEYMEMKNQDFKNIDREEHPTTNNKTNAAPVVSNETFPLGGCGGEKRCSQ